MGNMELITATTLTGTAASVTFSSIPQTYNDLVLRISARNDAASFSNMAFYLNSSSTSYSYTRLRGDGAAASSSRSTGPGYVYGGPLNWSSTTSSTFTSTELYIPKYTSSAYKPISVIGMEENNAATAYIDALATLWSNTSAITSIECNLNQGNFVSGSTFRLYGISNT